MTMKRSLKILPALLLLGYVGACEVPSAPLGSSGPSASPTAIPSESPDNGDPPCMQALQCIIDNTNNNALRRQTQEVVNQLLLTSEPDFTRICLSNASDLVERVPECVKN